MVIPLTSKTFNKEIQDGPIIVDFWASWCGPCKMLAPVFEEVSRNYEGRLKFAKLSTEEFPEIAQEKAVQGIPCLILFNQGEEIGRIVGFKPAQQLKQKIDEVLAKI